MKSTPLEHSDFIVPPILIRIRDVIADVLRNAFRQLTKPSLVILAHALQQIV